MLILVLLLLGGHSCIFMCTGCPDRMNVIDITISVVAGTGTGGGTGGGTVGTVGGGHVMNVHVTHEFIHKGRLCYGLNNAIVSSSSIVTIIRIISISISIRISITIGFITSSSTGCPFAHMAGKAAACLASTALVQTSTHSIHTL